MIVISNIDKLAYEVLHINMDKSKWCINAQPGDCEGCLNINLHEDCEVHNCTEHFVEIRFHNHISSIDFDDFEHITIY